MPVIKATFIKKYFSILYKKRGVYATPLNYISGSPPAL
jgi:hypothetical protein